MGNNGNKQQMSSDSYVTCTSFFFPVDAVLLLITL
jgi:hypothetical protein